MLARGMRESLGALDPVDDNADGLDRAELVDRRTARCGRQSDRLAPRHRRRADREGAGDAWNEARRDRAKLPNARRTLASRLLRAIRACVCPIGPLQDHALSAADMR